MENYGTARQTTDDNKNAAQKISESRITTVLTFHIPIFLYLQCLGDQDVDGSIILRWIFRKWEGVVGTGWSWLRIGTGGGRNELWGSIKCGEFLD